MAAVVYESLVPSGFFSSNPDDLKIPRSIRTNNPGALNISPWQTKFPGYVRSTPPDPSGNVTTIYRTPEHGIAAWYHLLAKRYGFGLDGKPKLSQIAVRYAGAKSANSVAAKTYIAGWTRLSSGTLTRDSIIDLADEASTVRFARCVFAHEAGKKSPLLDTQIRFALAAYKAGTLPP